jgi:hypothetical protein
MYNYYYHTFLTMIVVNKDHIKMALKQNENPLKNLKFPPKKTKKIPNHASREVLSNMGILFIFLGVFLFYSKDF